MLRDLNVIWSDTREKISERWFEKLAGGYEPVKKKKAFTKKFETEEEPEEMDGLRQFLANKEKRTFKL